MSSKYSKKGKSPKRTSQSNKIADDDEIDEIMENITLKRPRSAYTHFCIDEIENFRKKNKGKAFELKTFSKECAKKWADLSDKEKDKYKDRFEEDKIKYKSDLEKVRHYLFKDFNDVVRRPPTAYRIFLNERLREGFDKNLDPKEVKTQASKDWRMMSNEDRQVYFERKKDNDDWFERSKHTKKVTPLSIFVQKTIQSAKDKDKEPPKLAEIGPAWKKLPNSEKEKYRKYADNINEERERLYDIYELVNGIKPKKPAGAFRVFLQEKAKEKVLHSLQEGRELWEKLSEEEKEKYLKKAHTCRVAYKYKKMIYNKKIKKILPKRPANAYAQFLKEKKGQKVPKGEKAVAYWRESYDQLPKDKKKKYEEKAARDKERNKKKMEVFKNCTFDMPKRPLNAFSLFVKDRIPDLKTEKKDVPTAKLLKIVAKEWKEEDGVSQSQYEKKAERDKKRFKRQLKEFEKLGYYKNNSRGERTKKDEEDDEDEDEDEEENSKRRSMKKKRSSSRSSSRRGTKKTKSTSKTQETRRRSTSKNKKKTGRTQKKK